MTNQKAAEIREAETLEAARRTGVQFVEFLREPDGLLQPTLALRKKIVREIRRYRPEVVVTGDPTVVFFNDTYINHPDHRAASTTALDAVFPAAGQPNLFQELSEEGFFAHKTRKVYITNSPSPDIFVRIDETLPIKLNALKAHASQFNGWDPTEMVTEWAAERAAGLDMKYAEAFKVITLENDEAWERLKQKQNLQG
jgi:LmbE family N-acetylglucosaminyl deacetylase